MIPAPIIRPDPAFTLAHSLVINFGAVDASCTVPQPASQNLNDANSANDHLSLYLVEVAGGTCFFNIGAAATTSCGVLAVGTHGPWHIPPGTVVHALQSSGTGYLSLIRARML